MTPASRHYDVVTDGKEEGKKVSTLQPPLNMDLLTAAVTLTVLR